ncbi:cell division protein FtsQ/DivIB [Bifidobacterium goeldii]|uniref:cell division protein FtsQ/DivIB n=1 Tax=Bifidobacterium goeldii TaxID=2306975 RepID=UPI003B97A8DD
MPRTSRSSSRSRTRTRQTQAAVSRRFGRSTSSRTSARSASPARPQTGSRTVNSGTVERSSEGGFVDARRLHSDDVVSKTLNENVGVLGVATRPKVLDFDARLREKRKASVRVIALRVTAIVAAIAAVCALVWLLFFSTVFRLETSQISVTGGNEWVSERDVLNIAGKQAGKSLLLVSTDDVSTQLQSIPGVTQATVVKHYPRSLSVAVKAQQPAAMLKSSDGSMVAVDRKARVLNAVGDASTEGIPVIEVSDVNRGLNNRAVKEALKVLGGLPDTMRQTITKVTAKTQDSITTQMSGTYTVVWGDSSDLKLKAAIVDKLINDPTKIGDKHQVDVSAPSRPIIK